MKMTMVEFHLQSTQAQAAIDKKIPYNSLNDRLMMRLKSIQVDYYSIENQKSYSNTM